MHQSIHGVVYSVASLQILTEKGDPNMKKNQRLWALILLGAMLISMLTGCDWNTYEAASGFYYSRDKGHTYGDGTKEYEVGETVYMKVTFKVTAHSFKSSQVKVMLMIPNVENVDAKYMDGQVITPNFDPVNNMTTYEFTANASRDAMEHECVIQFVPNAVGSVTMTLIYDDNVDPSYDIQSTLVFVEPKGTLGDRNAEG